jgi:hypothetical protein
VCLVKCVLKEHVSLAVALIQIVKQMKYAYTTSAGNLNGSSNKFLPHCYHILTFHCSFYEFTTESMVQNHVIINYNNTNSVGLLSVIRSLFW